MFHSQFNVSLWQLSPLHRTSMTLPIDFPVATWRRPLPESCRSSPTIQKLEFCVRLIAAGFSPWNWIFLAWISYRTVSPKIIHELAYCSVGIPWWWSLPGAQRNILIVLWVRSTPEVGFAGYSARWRALPAHRLSYFFDQFFEGRWLDGPSSEFWSDSRCAFLGKGSPTSPLNFILRRPAVRISVTSFGFSTASTP